MEMSCFLGRTSFEREHLHGKMRQNLLHSDGLYEARAEMRFLRVSFLDLPVPLKVLCLYVRDTELTTISPVWVMLLSALCLASASSFTRKR